MFYKKRTGKSILFFRNFDKDPFNNLIDFIRIGKNDYLNEFKLFSPWVNSYGLVTWVPEVRLNTKCSIKVCINCNIF